MCHLPLIFIVYQTGVFCVSQIQVLESLLESWLENENVVQTLKTWFSVQEEKLKKKHRIEDVSSAQNALKDCQVGTAPIVVRLYIMHSMWIHE